MENIELQCVVSDLLLTSKNENWMRNVLTASHIISDKLLDIYDPTNRNYFKGVKYNYGIFETGIFSECDVLVVVDRIIDVYIISKQKKNRTKKILNIVGYNSTIKDISKGTLKSKILKKKEEFSFLQDTEYKIIYFPFNEDKDKDGEFHIFREIAKNTFLVDSLSNNLNNKHLNIREGFSRKDIIEMVLDTIYDEEE